MDEAKRTMGAALEEKSATTDSLDVTRPTFSRYFGVLQMVRAQPCFYELVDRGRMVLRGGGNELTMLDYTFIA